MPFTVGPLRLALLTGAGPVAPPGGAVGGRGVGVAWTGMTSFCPTKINPELLSPLARTIASTVLLKRAAIPMSVSPATTVYSTCPFKFGPDCVGAIDVAFSWVGPTLGRVGSGGSVLVGLAAG